ncbi:MAG: hypothetical protein PUK79_03080 [Clostridiales bacterium]|nr:hypothetical protein [Clostridiales bacterium]MDY2834589.1 hypothetical protein [Candidatus Aphodomonas sp.]
MTYDSELMEMACKKSMAYDLIRIFKDSGKDSFSVDEIRLVIDAYIKGSGSTL